MRAMSVTVGDETLGVHVTEGEGAPLVLLHGAGGHGATWAAVARMWGDPCVAPDLPGRGASTGQPRTTVAELAEVVAGTIAALGLERPMLLGHSLGGAIALQVALDHPAAVGGLVLVSSGARLRVAPAILDAVDAATQDAPFSLDLAFHPATRPDVVQAYLDATATTPVAATAADWHACDGFDVRDRLAGIRLPTLVVYGRTDALTPPRFQEAMTDALPHAAQVALHDTGHMLPWERPARLVEAVHAWR